MLRVDESTHRIITIQWQLERHRFAVPLRWSVGQAARRSVDSMIQPNLNRSNERKPNQIFTLIVDGYVKPPHTPMREVHEGSYCTVKELENEE